MNRVRAERTKKKFMYCYFSLRVKDDLGPMSDAVEPVVYGQITFSVVAPCHSAVGSARNGTEPHRKASHAVSMRVIVTDW